MDRFPGIRPGAERRLSRFARVSAAGLGQELACYGVNTTGSPADIMLIEALEDRFARKLSGHCRVSDNAFRVTRKNDSGFDVWIREEGRRSFVVGFDDWQEKFADPTAALACFAQGLSNQCRLVILSRLGKDFRLEVEQWRQGRWIRTGERGPKLFAPWPIGRRRILQNDWLHEESAA